MMKQTKNLERLLNTLSTRMRNRRRSLGITQEHLAEKIGLTANYIARLEMGVKTPSVATLVAIAEALEVDVSELLSFGRKHSWVDSAQEIGRIMQSLSREDSQFVLDQVTATVNHMKSTRRPPDE